MKRIGAPDLETVFWQMGTFASPKTAVSVPKTLEYTQYKWQTAQSKQLYFQRWLPCWFVEFMEQMFSKLRRGGPKQKQKGDPKKTSRGTWRGKALSKSKSIKDLQPRSVSKYKNENMMIQYFSCWEVGGWSHFAMQIIGIAPIWGVGCWWTALSSKKTTNVYNLSISSSFRLA